MRSGGASRTSKFLKSYLVEPENLLNACPHETREIWWNEERRSEMRDYPRVVFVHLLVVMVNRVRVQFVDEFEVPDFNRNAYNGQLPRFERPELNRGGFNIFSVGVQNESKWDS